MAIPQMSNLTLQAGKSLPEKGPKTPESEKNDDTIDTEEINITVKQNNDKMTYELKPIDLTEIGKSMEAETSLDDNSEVWEPTPNGQETLEDTMDTTTEQGARSCVAQRTR